MFEMDMLDSELSDGYNLYLYVDIQKWLDLLYHFLKYEIIHKYRIVRRVKWQYLITTK